MSNGTKLLPLAKVGGGQTLCTTATQDRYFLVATSGGTKQVDLLKACRLYQEATEVVWGRRVTRAKTTAQQPQRSTQKWQRKIREALGTSEDKSEE